MSTNVVKAPASHAKQSVPSKASENQTEEQRAASNQDEHERPADADEEVTVADAGKAPDGDVQAADASPETSLAGDFSFSGALAEAAAAAGSLISETEETEVSVDANFGGDDSQGTILLIGAIILLGVGIWAIADSGHKNEAPTAGDDVSATTNEDTPVNVTVSATDPDGDTLTYTAGAAAHGTVTGGAGGTFTYTPAADFNGTDSFTVKASDPDGLSSGDMTVTITIAAVNDGPRPDAGNTATLTIDEDTSGIIDIVFTDPEGDEPLSLQVTDGPDHGTFALVDGENTYTPDPDYNGPDSVTYVVLDSLGVASDPFTVDITVTPVDEPPGVSLDIVGPDSTTPADASNGHPELSATGGDIIYLDDANVATDVILSNFTNGDTIVVTNATAGQYNFSTGVDENDLAISYTAGNGAVNLILIDDVLPDGSLFFDLAGATAAIGFDFMSFA